MDELSRNWWLYLAFAVMGFGFFRLILILLPLIERREIFAQKKEVLKEAHRQKAVVTESAINQTDRTLMLFSEELEAELVERREFCAEAAAELDGHSETCTLKADEVGKLEIELVAAENQYRKISSQAEEKAQKTQALIKRLREALEARLQLNSSLVLQEIVDSKVQERQIAAQKANKQAFEELQVSGKKRAARVLSRTLARYEPNFHWPKPQSTLDCPDARLFDELASDGNEIISGLEELSGVNIKLLPSENEVMASQMRAVGGYGIARESVRLTLEKLLKNRSLNLQDLQKLYQKNFRNLEQEATRLGRVAINILNLRDVHGEILKLVGALNWRTSYRQNQWYHTLEVATLAGMLANEVGVDPEKAKRVGLLHDIGKALDYRIEGSHAIISGDYADRYGESKVICDTVMSHHDDLLLDTPLANVLKAADTLSGARPGARVNLDEGYQIRLDAIFEIVNGFKGITDVSIMSGGREVHIQVDHAKIDQADLETLGDQVVKRIEEEVAFPGQIKVVINRVFESVMIAG